MIYSQSDVHVSTYFTTVDVESLNRTDVVITHMGDLYCLVAED